MRTLRRIQEKAHYSTEFFAVLVNSLAVTALLAKCTIPAGLLFVILAIDSILFALMAAKNRM